jgi:hypothetical protein
MFISNRILLIEENCSGRVIIICEKYNKNVAYCFCLNINLYNEKFFQAHEFSNVRIE